LKYGNILAIIHLNVFCDCQAGAWLKTRLSAKGLTILETLITLCIIGVLTGVVIVKYRQVTQAAKETALKAGLVNIRMSVTLFKMLNNRNPDSLKEMVEKKVMLPARIGPDKYTDPIFLKESYLMEYATDKEGNIIDAFDNPFTYDAAKGEVRTTTKGYEAW
jgi:type II secretory pathway pseudopilin PulG